MRENDHENPVQDASPDILEELGSFPGDGESGDLAKAKRFVKLQLYLPRKEAVLLEELRIRRMKRGQDISRSRLICEALYTLIQKESESKNRNLG